MTEVITTREDGRDKHKGSYDAGLTVSSNVNIAEL